MQYTPPFVTEPSTMCRSCSLDMGAAGEDPRRAPWRRRPIHVCLAVIRQLV